MNYNVVDMKSGVPIVVLSVAWLVSFGPGVARKPHRRDAGK